MVTFSIERFSDVYGELKPLLEQHYAEISTHKDHGVPLEPIEEAYHARQNDGSLLMMIGREAGVIVAYFVCFIAPGLHYRSCLTCSPDIFYVEQTKRGRHTAVQMFNFVKAELKRRGVKRWAVGCKVEHDASSLFEYLGFMPVEKIYEMWLEE